MRLLMYPFVIWFKLRKRGCIQNEFFLLYYTMILGEGDIWTYIRPLRSYTLAFYGLSRYWMSGFS